MKINKELTENYYKNYSPCTCDYCKNYFLQIEKEYPEVCAFLKDLNIDVLKPFELMFLEEKDKIKYIGCMYVVYGTVSDDYKHKIKEVTFEINKNNHPSTGIEEKHFVLDFGTIELPIILDELKK